MWLKMIHDLSCASTILANILIIAIIVRKTPAKLHSYSIILMNFAIVESATAGGLLMLYSRVLSTDKYWICVIEGPCRLTGSTPFCAFVISWTIHFQSQYCVLLAFSFCYRYYAIDHSSPSKLGLMMILTIIYIPTTIIYLFFAVAPLLEKTTLLTVMADLYPEYSARGRTNFIFGAEKRGAIRLGLAWNPLLIGPVYVIVIVSSIFVHRSLVSTLKMSEKSKKMHRAIMKALTLQSLLPALFVIALAFHYARLYHLVPEWEESGHLTLTLLSIQFAASPIITLSCIRPYRLAVKSFFVARSAWFSSKQNCNE